jgi:hypothetical protein
LTILAVLAIGGFVLSGRLQQQVAAKPSASPIPAESTPATPSVTEPASSPATTVQPSANLVGVFPAPDATIPANAPPIIPALNVADLASAATANGLTCVSEAGTYQEGSGGYTLACDGEDRAGHAKLGLSVTYWTLDGVSELYFSVWADQPGAVVSPATPIKLMSAISSLSRGDVAKIWVMDHLDDSDCRDTCSRTEGTVRLEVQSGDNGGRALHVIATAS